MIYLLLFYKPIRTSGAMQLWMFLPLVSVLIKKSTIFGLAFSRAALLRFCQRGDFSSHFLRNVPITVGYLPYWDISVLQGVIQHLGYFISWDYHLCTIWTVSQGFHSVLRCPFDCSISPNVLEGVSNDLVKLAVISAQYVLPDPPIYFRQSLLLSPFCFDP